MANAENSSVSPRPTSVERDGVGQSGYAAGRREGDHALAHHVDTRYASKPGSGADGLGTDDRFTGRGAAVGGDVERDGLEETVAQPYPQANGIPDPDTSEPDGASGRWDDDPE
jgi:hypothetical protein